MNSGNSGRGLQALMPSRVNSPIRHPGRGPKAVGMPIRGAYAALSAAQKPGRGVSAYSRYINRPLGKFLAAVSARVGLSPNGVTMISAILTVAAVVLIATQRPNVFIGVAVALLLVFGFALDAADGQLARLLNRASAVGEWLDHVVDAGKAVCLHGAVLISAYRHFPVDLWWLLVPLSYQTVGVVVQAGGTLRELLGRLARGGQPKPAAESRPWSPWVLLVADSGVFALAFLSWPWPSIFIVVYSGLFVGNLLLGAALLLKWRQELSGMVKISAS